MQANSTRKFASLSHSKDRIMNSPPCVLGEGGVMGGGGEGISTYVFSNLDANVLASPVTSF